MTKNTSLVTQTLQNNMSLVTETMRTFPLQTMTTKKITQNDVNQGEVLLWYPVPDYTGRDRGGEKLILNNSVDVYGNKSFALSAYELVAPVLLGICLMATLGFVGILLKRTHAGSSLTRTSCILLISIAMADALTMAFASIELVYLYTERRGNYMYIPLESCNTMYVLERLSSIPHAASTWLTVVLAIQRYVCVSVPFQAVRYINTKSTVIYVTVIFFLSLSLHSYRFFDKEFTEIWIKPSSDSDLLILTCISNYRSWIRNPVLYESVFAWMRIIVTQLLPCILIIIFVVLMVKVLRNVSEFSANTRVTKRQTDRRQLTRFIVCVSGIVFGVELSNAIFLSFNAFKISTGISIFTYDVLKTASIGFDIVLYLSYFVIFLIYCLMSHDFRIEVVSVFNRICYYSRDKQHIIDKSVVNVNNSGECSSSKQSTSLTRF